MTLEINFGPIGLANEGLRVVNCRTLTFKSTTCEEVSIRMLGDEEDLKRIEENRHG